MRLLVEAPIMSASGLGLLSRNFIKLLSEKFEFAITDRSTRGSLTTLSFKMTAIIDKMPKVENPDTCIQIYHPEEFQPKPNMYNILVTNPLSTALPAPVITNLNRANEIWTGSQTTANVLKNMGVVIPILVVPTPIDITESSDQELPIAGINYNENNEFIPREERVPTIGIIAPWNRRRNPEDALVSILSQFNHGDCKVILKSYTNVMSLEENFQISRIIGNLRRQFTSGPEITIITKVMTDIEITQLFNMCDVYCSACRFESSGIDILTAALLGVPTVVSGSGCINDILPSYPYVSGSVAEPVCELGPALTSNWWARPDLLSMYTYLRQIMIEGPDEKAIGKTRDKVIERHSLYSVRQQIEDYLSDR